MSVPVAAEPSLGVLEAIFARRSVRAFTSERVDPSLVRVLLNAAVQAPTAFYEEPWLFAVVQDCAMLRRLSDRARALLRQEVGFIAELSKREFDIFYDASTLVVVCGRPMGSFVAADCWLAAENLMLAACGVGLGTCCIGAALPALNSPDLKAALEIPPEVTPVAPIVIGVPADAAVPRIRRDPQILSWSGATAWRL